MPATLWERTKTNSKVGFDKAYGLVDKLGPPVNKLSNKLGSEAFWPTTLDKESDKAARILRSFCKDGFYREETVQTEGGPMQKQRVLQKIPSEVIRNAKGLAIFTTMRTGLWISGSGGSGVLVGRKADGTWSPPSGIMLQTMGLGFLAGVDIYDCVIVINTQQALDAFSTLRCTIGGQLSVVAGPLGAGGMLETEVHKRQAPAWNYIKSRGFYAGVEIDGTVVIERTDENERFYNERISVGDILDGKVRHPPYETRALLETIKMAQGDKDVDQRLLPPEPSPSDHDIESKETTLFGIPAKEDPDPFGVLALEREGLEIREAGTKQPVPVEEFEFRPNLTSPIYASLSRASTDSGLPGSRSALSGSRRSSWRTSMFSTKTQVADMSTQTDFGSTPPQSSSPPKAPSPRRSHSPSRFSNGHFSPGDRWSPSLRPAEERDSEELSALPTRPTSLRTTDPNRHHSPNCFSPRSPSRSSVHSRSSSRSTSPMIRPSFDDTTEDVEDAVVVHSVQQAHAPQAFTKAKVVEVRKRSPPKLPPRNPQRASKGPLVMNAEQQPRIEIDSEEEAPNSGPNSERHNRFSSGFEGSGVQTRLVARPARPDLSKERVAKDENDDFHSLPPTPKEDRANNPTNSPARADRKMSEDFS